MGAQIPGTKYCTVCTYIKALFRYPMLCIVMEGPLAKYIQYREVCEDRRLIVQSFLMSSVCQTIFTHTVELGFLNIHENISHLHKYTICVGYATHLVHFFCTFLSSPLFWATNPHVWQHCLIQGNQSIGRFQVPVPGWHHPSRSVCRGRFLRVSSAARDLVTLLCRMHNASCWALEEAQK